VLSDPRDHPAVKNRAVVVQKLKALPVEAVVRGYLIGSGWKDYCKTGRVSGVALPQGLELADRLREPIFTPSTKAGPGKHDENISMADVKNQLGAELALTYLNEKAKGFVEPLAKQLQAPILMPLEVTRPGEMEAVFERIRKDWGRLDILVHSIAFAPKDDLAGGLLECSAAGFGVAMDVSVHSFIRMAKLSVEPGT